jgi:WD40 repeat protein
LRYELIHDVVARQVFEKASGAALARRKAEHFLEDRFAFCVPRGLLLSKGELEYLEPFLPSISVSPASQAFVERSQAAVRKRARVRKWGRRAAVALVAALVLGGWGTVVWLERARDKAVAAATVARVQTAVASMDDVQPNRAFQLAKTLRERDDLGAEDFHTRKAFLGSVYQLSPVLPLHATQQLDSPTPIDMMLTPDGRTLVVTSVVTSADPERADTVLVGAWSIPENWDGVDFLDLVPTSVNPDTLVPTVDQPLPTVDRTTLLPEDADSILASSARGEVATLMERTNDVAVLNPDGSRVVLQAPSRTRNVVFLQDRPVVISSHADGALRAWNMNPFGNVRPLVTLRHADGVTDVALSPTAHEIVTTSRDGTAVLWDSLGRPKHRLSNGIEGSAYTSAAFSPGGDRIALTRAPGGISLWRSNGDSVWGHTHDELAGLEPPMRTAHFVGDSSIVSIGYTWLYVHEVDGTREWRESYVGIGTGSSYPYAIADYAVSPSGDSIALVTPWADGTRVWEFDGLSFRGKSASAPFQSGQSVAGRVAYSADGERIMLTKGSQAFVHHSDGHLIGRLEEPWGSVTAVAFLRESDYALTGSTHGVVRLWYVAEATPELVFAFRPHRSAVTALDVSVDSSRFATASEDSISHVWPLSDALILQQLDALPIPPLTAVEKIRYLRYSAADFLDEPETGSAEVLAAARHFANLDSLSEAEALYGEIGADATLLEDEELERFFGELSDDSQALVRRARSEPDLAQKEALYQQIAELPRGRCAMTLQERIMFLDYGVQMLRGDRCVEGNPELRDSEHVGAVIQYCRIDQPERAREFLLDLTRTFPPDSFPNDGSLMAIHGECGAEVTDDLDDPYPNAFRRRVDSLFPEPVP